MSTFHVQLLNDSLFEFDEEKWPAVGSSSYMSLRDGGYLAQRLTIGRNADGRTLVYVVNEPPDGDKIVAGELLPPNSADVGSVARRLAERFALPERTLEGCLASYRKATLTRPK